MLEGRLAATFILVITIFVLPPLTRARSDALAPEGLGQLSAEKSPAAPDDRSSNETSSSEALRGDPAAPARSEAPEPKPADAFQAEVVKAAEAHALPVDFFTRLIWQESRFKPYAVSRAGAQGIAQFMPGTAQWRGLSDPFDPPEALHESARWLRELWGQFGNLGLAAAAYNAGPGRVTRWLAGRSSLPAETRAYVKIVTGEPAERWSGCADIEPEQACPGISAGLAAAGTGVSVLRPLRMQRPLHAVLATNAVAISDIDAGPWGPWGLQLAGDWSQSRALAQFKKIQTKFAGVLGDRRPVILRGQMAGRGSATWYRVRIAEATRERAVSLCAKLEKAGGSCMVLQN